MIGRPRRRHVIDQSGRLRHGSPATTKASGKRGQRQSIISKEDQKTAVSRWLKIAFGLVIVLAIGLGVWAVAGVMTTYSKVVDTNSTKRAPILSFLGEVKPNQLQGEGDGRINVLLIGIGGAKHPGGTLADTIMVASLDPKNKEAALLSIPRDLWVPISGNGSGKINSAHSYGEQKAKKSGGGPAVMKKTVSDILDLPIHYYIRIDFSALEKIVDTLGGVTVDVENPIVDYTYPADNMIDYAPFRLAAGPQKLDGKTALKYVRSRHAAGLEGSDFARARRQQKLLEAVKQKSMTVGVLGNPKKIGEFMTILGDHVKTDITLSEGERFLQIWKDIDESKVVSKVLDNGPDGPLVSHSGDARGSILLPRAGTGDFSEVQQIAHEIFTDPFLRQEKAKISFVNATGSTTKGQQILRQLKSFGYDVTDDTPKGQEILKKTELIDRTGDKPYTVRFLSTRFKTEAVLRRSNDSAHDIELTVGTDYTTSQTKSTKAITSPKASVQEGSSGRTTTQP